MLYFLDSNGPADIFLAALRTFLAGLLILCTNLPFRGRTDPSLGSSVTGSVSV